MISTMGPAALKIISNFPPFFAFYIPTAVDDRKHWSVTKDGVTYVSTSIAYRPNCYFINSETKLDLCLICSKILSHKFVVVCSAIIWKENYTAQDLINWTSRELQRRACYIHWRSPSAERTPQRNPYTIKNKKGRNNQAFHPSDLDHLLNWAHLCFRLISYN